MCDTDGARFIRTVNSIYVENSLAVRERPFRSPTQPQRQSLVYHSILPWAVCLERAEVTMGTTLVAGAPYGPVLPLSFRSLHTPTLDRFITFTSRSRM